MGTGIHIRWNVFKKSQWLTADLGFKRANNYVMIYLELYDPNTHGQVNYILERKMMIIPTVLYLKEHP